MMMTTKHVDETKVMASIVRLLESLDADARKRVLAYLAARYYPEAK
jgi:hypothetical protein